MKSPLILLGLLVISTVQAQSSLLNLHQNVKNRLSQDFLTGFESGLFSRDSTTHFKEYGCPTEHANNVEIKAFKEKVLPMFQAVTAMTGMQDDPTVKELYTTIELFINNFNRFIGVFDTDYKGGDFCAGLTFGMEGSNMLETVAKKLYTMHFKNKAKEARSHGPK